MLPCLAALACLLLHAPQAESERPSPELHLPLRALYAADPGTEYTAGWEAFLSEHLEEVRFVSRAELTPELVRGFDVLVIDGELMEGGVYKPDEAEVPLRLSDLQGFPVLLMGGIGGRVSTQWKLAGSWGLHGCHCLSPWLVVPPAQERPAVFRTPFPIDEAPRRLKTPRIYVEHDPALPAELEALRVFESDPAEPGYVTQGDFRALPDAEWLASGLNSKSAGHAALLRHGSFVLWGFHGPASQLTSAGQKLFWNALACARSHAGVLVENLRLAAPREQLLIQFQSLAPRLEPEERAEKLEWLSSTGFPDSVLEDPARAPAWFETIRGHLRALPRGYGFEVDSRCVELGPANDEPRFLDELARRLSVDSEDPLARELLRRYVPAAPRTDAAGCVAWLRAHRDQLHFTDVGSYVWKLAGERADVFRPLMCTPSAAGSPLDLSAEANEEELVLTLELRVGWHLYAHAEGALAPLVLTPTPGSGYELGPFMPPADERGRLTRRVELRVPLRRKSEGEGLTLDVSFQACDADSCRPVETLRLER